ncbi:MAG: FliI/YscN family ATPase [Bdellovibrionota bacterium]|nr:FliI/YscN family ATPase [Pseudomonadota bacterium]MDY6091514.1 FliI/YscN family ATPase [Bdellovibrionota bacterium]
MGLLDKANAALNFVSPFELKGSVVSSAGILIEANGPKVPVGSHVAICTNGKEHLAQVVGFKNDNILVMPFDLVEGVTLGTEVISRDSSSGVLVSDKLIGRVIDGLGNPMDGKEAILTGEKVSLHNDPPNPVTRTRIKDCFDTGVRAINGLLTIGLGQRIGIMAGSGVGKSTLLGMIARHSDSDINVIALIGERGREVREFIEKDLGEEGIKRSIVVVATGDKSAILRIRAAFLATSISEYFRAKGKKVVLMMDSVTRLAMAQREIGLATGEPPSTKGYTPSVFAMLPKLLERAGTCDGEGSITGLYTVLVEGDDMNEPIADTTRGILDGHFVLDRKLAGRGHFPAIDVLQSVSRVMPDIVSSDVVDMASEVRDLIATYRDNEDLITIGAYKAGQNLKVDRAVSLNDKINGFLKQKASEKCTKEETFNMLKEILTNEG